MVGRLGTTTYRLPSSDDRRWPVLRGLATGGAWLVRMVTAAVVRTGGSRRRNPPRISGDRADAAAAVGDQATVRRYPQELLSLSAVAPPPDITPPTATAATAQLDAVVFDYIAPDRDFNDVQYPTAFSELQRGASRKLWDLRSVETIELDLFDRLADDWTAGLGLVQRLGVLLDFERWVVLHTVAARRLQPLIKRGVAVEIFYDQQLTGTVPAWFTGGPVEHPLPAILQWLGAEWRPKPNWRRVLDTTAMLATGFSAREQVPDQLIQLAAIAILRLGTDGAREAMSHLETALSWIGDTPSSVRCRALRTLASSLRLRGKTHEALLKLDAANRTAVLIGDPCEEASALADLGFHLQQVGHLVRAETLFRRALSRLPVDELPYLRAMLHQHLALVLYDQRKNLDEAAQHAAAALALRGDNGSHVPHDDHALLERMRDGASVPANLSTLPTSLSLPPRASS
jgi:tetratricopeptide (TPR) repeat protein